LVEALGGFTGTRPMILGRELYEGPGQMGETAAPPPEG
jgi:hypothetical protein